MSGRRILAALMGAALALVLVPALPANASVQYWNGTYSLLRYAAAKTGTSLAARQPEPDFSDNYQFRTSCFNGTCIATVIAGPAPKNPTLPQPPQYTWDGKQWVHIYDWQWDCYMGEGQPKVWAPARSWAYYVPQLDGTLRGSWTTQIYGGPCDGTVAMAVAAFRA